MKERPADIFKSRDIDLIAFLRYRGFCPIGCPLEDSNGTRWAVFKKNSALDSAVMSFLSGNAEAKLLNEFRKSRSFLLDSMVEKEIGEKNAGSNDFR